MAAEHRIADDGHHVTDRRGRAFRIRHTVGAVEKVVRGEVLEQVTCQPLDNERQEDAASYITLGIFGFFAQGGNRLEAAEQEDRDSSLQHDRVETMRSYYRPRAWMGR